MLLYLTNRITTQGRALVRAIEALSTIEPSGPFEQALARRTRSATRLGYAVQAS